MFTYCREILPPSSVTAATNGSFIHRSSNDLFVARGNSLELYTVEGVYRKRNLNDKNDGNSGSDANGKDGFNQYDAEGVPYPTFESGSGKSNKGVFTKSAGGSRIDDSEESGIALVPQLRHVGKWRLHGDIVDIKTIRCGRTGRDSRIDSLLLSFSEAKMSLVEYSADTQNIITISLHYYEHDDLKRSFVSNTGANKNYIRVDPKNRCALMQFYQDKIAIIPFHDLDTIHLTEDPDTDAAMTKDQSGIYNKPSFIVDMWDSQYNIKRIRDITFLYGYTDPVIAILHQPIIGWAGSLETDADTCAISILSLDLNKKSMVVIHTIPHLPNDMYRLFSIPYANKGFLAIGSSTLAHINNGSLAGITALNKLGVIGCGHYTKMGLDTKTNVDLGIVLDDAHAAVIDSSGSTFGVWNNRGGQPYLLRLNESRRNHTELLLHPVDSGSLDYFGCINNMLVGLDVAPSCIVSLSPMVNVPTVNSSNESNKERQPVGRALLFIGSNVGNSALVTSARPTKNKTHPAPIIAEENKTTSKDKSDQTSTDIKATKSKKKTTEKPNKPKKKNKEDIDEDSFLYGDEDDENNEEDENEEEEEEESDSNEIFKDDDGNNNEDLDGILDLNSGKSQPGSATTATVTKQTPKRSWYENFRFRISDYLSGFCPITQMDIGPSTATISAPDANISSNNDSDDIEIMACTGSATQGSLVVLQRNIRPDVLSSFKIPGESPIQNVWTIQSSSTNTNGSSALDGYSSVTTTSWMVISSQTSTMVFSITNEIKEMAGRTGFEAKSPTVCVGQISGSRYIVQAHMNGVRVVDSGCRFVHSLDVSDFGQDIGDSARETFISEAEIQDPYILVRIVESSKQKASVVEPGSTEEDEDDEYTLKQQLQEQKNGLTQHYRLFKCDESTGKLSSVKLPNELEKKARNVHMFNDLHNMFQSSTPLALSHNTGTEQFDLNSEDKGLYNTDKKRKRDDSASKTTSSPTSDSNADGKQVKVAKTQATTEATEEISDLFESAANDFSGSSQYYGGGWYILAHLSNGDLAIYNVISFKIVWRMPRFDLLPELLENFDYLSSTISNDGIKQTNNEDKTISASALSGSEKAEQVVPNLGNDNNKDSNPSPIDKYPFELPSLTSSGGARHIDQISIAVVGEDIDKDERGDVYLVVLTTASELALYKAFIPTTTSDDVLQRACLPVRFVRVGLDTISYFPDYMKQSWMLRKQIEVQNKEKEAQGSPESDQKANTANDVKSKDKKTADGDDDSKNDLGKPKLDEEDSKKDESAPADNGGDDNVEEPLVSELESLPFDFEEAYEERPPSSRIRYSKIMPFDNVSGFKGSGVFVAGAQPMWIVAGDHKSVRVHRMRVPENFILESGDGSRSTISADTLTKNNDNTNERNTGGIGGSSVITLSPAQLHPISSFGTFNQPAMCENGIVAITQNGSLLIATLPDNGIDYSQPWPMRHIPIGPKTGVGSLAAASIAYHPTSGDYGIITCTTKPFYLKEQDPEVALAEAKASDAVTIDPNSMVAPPLIPEHERSDVATTSVPPQVPRFQLELVAPVGLETVDVHQFQLNEHVTAIKCMSLESKETDTGRKDFLVVGTTFVLGEEVTTRGKVYIWEVHEVVPQPGRPQTNRKLKLRYQKEFKGAISAIEELKGNLVMSIGSKLYVQSFEDNENLVSVAFLDCQCYITSMVSLRNFLIIGDLVKGVWFVGFQEEDPTKLQVLGVDYNSELPVSMVDYHVVGKDRLAILVADVLDGNMHVFTYSPYHTRSYAGQRLLRKGEYHLGSGITCIKRFWKQRQDSQIIADGKSATQVINDTNDSSGGAGVFEGSQVTIIATRSGAMYSLVSVPERTFKRMNMVNSRLTHTIPQNAGLNPRAFRMVPSHLRGDQNPQRLVLDGDQMQWYFVNGSLQRQREVTQQVGTTADRVLTELMQFESLADIF
ncbi:mRNA cleavage and polyadenylation factor subunit [Mycoemilia scoparia]|uniref:mRNA cleavage and polyadenylation factor subunit n=1 Tax=Mycoemilia scoparia TaxID=417184 RepID=A0A9W8A715_9FUNG|nr:mRNA cleavage and polyadenylation factor subunit [Mycoemilia scoparia]